MRQYDMKDAFIRTFEDMDHRGYYFAEFTLPRQCGATYSLLRAAVQSSLNPEDKVLVAFWSKQAADHALKDAGLNKVLKAVPVQSIANELLKNEYDVPGTVYIFIDNLQHSSIREAELNDLRDYVGAKRGKVKVLVVNTGAK